MMRARFAMMLGCLCGVAWLAGSTLHANPPLKDPRRVITGRTVNLEPLFRWWTNRLGERPLWAWAHVTGAVVATNDWGWTVEARVDPPPRARSSAQEGASAGGHVKVVLRHPPVSDLAEFSDLTAQAKALTDQTVALSNQVRAASNRLREIGSNGRRARVFAVQASRLRLVEEQDKAQLANLHLQLADCRAKLAGFPNSTKYVLDCLALDMGQEVNGLPLYDYGVPVMSYLSPNH
ncbi:MAG TPA: hypothetical protein VN829_24520 [Dongiaceae bacterium]|nr:hypothetical protein [Dongiaceae bacterium]